MSGAMSIFDEYSPSDKNAEWTLAGDLKEWTWFKIYVFTKKNIDLEKELKTLKKLWGIFCFFEASPFAWHIFWFYFKKKKSKVKLSFNFLVNFWTTADENGWMTWNVTYDKISLLYSFNDENIDLEQMISLLNNFAETYGFHIRSCKLLLVMQVSNSGHWNYDYFKKVEFILRRWFLLFLAL